jgi:YD repeat-containing protein
MTEIDFATDEVEHVAMDQYERPIGFNFSDPGNVQRWGNGSFADPNLPYQYDGAGNITSIGSAQGVSDNFTYDLLSRLTGATVNRQGYAHAYSYAYDHFGNLLGRTEAPANGAESLKASLVNTAAYRTPSQAPDETAAANYIKEVAFTAQLATGSNGVTNNRLSSVQRGGTVMGVATGLSQQSDSMAYDANGNLIDDGQYIYGYDPLNRQVSVRDKSTNLLVAEYAYLASGERIAALKYSGGEVSDYTRYVREGGAVVWEKSDSTGHEKRYIYAGGRMAYTEEAWVTCTLPKLASSPTQSLASLQVAPDANGQTVTATIALPGLPEEAQAAEVRLVKGNSFNSGDTILISL